MASEVEENEPLDLSLTCSFTRHRFANALGVSQRPSPRPDSGKFYSGDDLPTNIIVGMYPTSLLRWGTNDLSFLMRLERRWCEFIADRNSPSVQLRPMPRVLRATVHQYSGYWRMHTESFDPEPGRYISCVKMR